MESGSRIGDLFLNVEKEVMNGATETNLVDERLKQTNQNSNLNKVGYNNPMVLKRLRKVGLQPNSLVHI